MTAPLDDMVVPAAGAFECSAPRPESHPTALVLVVAGLTGLGLLPVFYRLISDPQATLFGYNDFTGHIGAARDLGFSPLVFPPHFLFHVLVRAAMPLTGPGAAAGIVSVASIALFVIALTHLGTMRAAGRPGLSTKTALVLAVGILIADSPSLLVSALGWSDLAYRVAVIHTWANPTDNIGAPFGTLLLVAVVGLLDTDDDPLVRTVRPRVLVALSILSMVSKPTFGVILLAALPLHLTATRAWARASTRRIVRSCLVPILVVLVLQVVILGVLAPPEIGRSGVVFAPLELVRQQRIGAGGPLFWSSIFPIAIGLWAGGRRYLKDTAVRLTLTALPLGVAGLLLFNETGPRAADGNLSRPAYAWWVLLLFCSTRFVALEIRDHWSGRAVAGERIPVWSVVFAICVVAALAGGLVEYHDALGWSPWLR